MRRYIFQLAVKLLWRSNQKSLFALMAVALGVSLLVSIFIIYEKMEQSIQQDLVQRYGNTDILVGYRTNKLLQGDQIKGIRETSGINNSSKVLVNPHKFSTEYNGLWNGIYYVGVDNSELSKKYYKFRDNLNQNEVVLSQKLATKLHAEIGKEVKIGFPSGKSQEWKVKEIISEQSSPGTPSLALFHLGSLQSALGLDEKVNLMLIDIKEGANANHIESLLRNNIDSTLDIDILSDYESVTSNIRSIALIGITLGILSIFTSILFVLSYFQLSIRQRERDLALLRAIGATKSHLFQMVIIEATIINTTGISLGIFIGISLSSLLSSYTATLFHIPFFQTPTPLAELFSINSIIWFLLILASIFPAYKVSKVLPLQTDRKKLPKSSGLFLKRNQIVTFLFIIGILSLFWGMYWPIRGDGSINALLSLGGGFLIVLTILFSTYYILGFFLKGLEYISLQCNYRKTFLALKNFAIEQRQKTGVILLLSLVISSYIVSSSILNILKEGAEKTAREQYISDLLVMSDLYMQSSIPYEIQNELESIQEVKSAVPLSIDYGAWVNHNTYVNYLISDIHKMTKYKLIELEQTEDLSQTVFIPKDYAKSLQLKTGDSIGILLDELRQTESFNVITVDKIPGAINQKRLFFDHTSELVKQMEEIRVQKVFVSLEKDVTPTVINSLESLQIQYPELSWGDLESELIKNNQQVNQRFGIVLIFQFIIGIIGVFGLINVLSAVIYHNRKEYAILRTIYLSPTDLCNFLIKQGLLICLLATLIGTGSGIILSLAFATSLDAPFQIMPNGIWVIGIVFLIGYIVSLCFANRLKKNIIVEELSFE